MDLNCNILLIIFGIIVVALIIYYFTNRGESLPESKIISPFNNIQLPQSNVIAPQGRDEISDSVLDTLLSKYNDADDFCASDPALNDEYSPFDDYIKKRNIDMRKMEQPYFEKEEDDERNFDYKKHKFTKRTPDDINDLFDVNKMLPQETEDGWFDVVPQQCTKKIKGTHLIHPKVHMGINTIGSSLKNGSHDIRGDIPNPKINVSLWNNSTIDPDTNIKGFCN
ncbi:hypothetical protein [Acanthamoeba polyphaga mimivirus]|uniref:Minor capsid protein P11 C-terminal conserved region domain-containing protein n=4 Tax=Megamimivirinae TaxID=3044648 RepID=A0A2L2DIX4_MIMIV|nr:hypothetical protein c7_L453 [Megavirus courdo7]AFX92435.1 hypothetical protein CE11_00408 [Megavirus courdo11]AGD92301.1 hypothetical protein LBA_00383 [Megavirus lba]AVG46122.1 hypothetical protein [Acanthamoeba polyphaga mimivirus]AVL93722.1 hypothetical protein mvi_362 [Megavirus vitis]